MAGSCLSTYTAPVSCLPSRSLLDRFVRQPAREIRSLTLRGISEAYGLNGVKTYVMKLYCDCQSKLCCQARGHELKSVGLYFPTPNSIFGY
jgi:hypothetical protein